MNNFRDVVPAHIHLAGEKADLNKQVINKSLTFVDWAFIKNKYGEGVILQFLENGKPFVLITHSICVRKDMEAYVQAKGKEPFVGTLGWKDTKKGHRALVFL